MDRLYYTETGLLLQSSSEQGIKTTGCDLGKAASQGSLGLRGRNGELVQVDLMWRDGTDLSKRIIWL